METWLSTCLVLCTYGFFKEMRPSEAFLTEYLIGPQHNLTTNQVYYEVYPVWTYSYAAVLVLVLLVTDILRYKPVIVFEGLGYIATWSLLLWGRGVPAMQAMEFCYAIATSTEVAYYTYIYAKVPAERYQLVTSFSRAAILIGRFGSGLLAQIFVSTGILDYHSLNYISMMDVSIAFCIACFLPSVSTSMYFHRDSTPINELPSATDSQDIFKDDNVDRQEVVKVDGQDTFKDVKVDGQDTFKDVKVDGQDTIKDVKVDGQDAFKDVKVDGQDTFKDVKVDGQDTIKDVKVDGQDAFKVVKVDGQDAFKDVKVDGQDTIKDVKVDGQGAFKVVKVDGQDAFKDVKVDGQDTFKDVKVDGQDAFKDVKVDGQDAFKDVKVDGQDTIKDFKVDGQDAFKDVKVDGQDAFKDVKVDDSTIKTDTQKKGSMFKKVKRVSGILWADFKAAYTDVYIVKWSVWCAFATCGNLQVGNYIQPLWEEISPVGETETLYNGAVEATQTLLSALAAFGVGYIHINWEFLGEPTLAIISLVDAFLLVSMGLTSQIWAAYINYIIFRISFQVLITIGSFQIARKLEAASYALVFGFNTFIALIIQSMLTLIVIGILELDPNVQFVVYGCYFGLLALVFFIISAFSLGRLGKEGLKQVSLWELPKEHK